ncbi:MAG: hypothetical protein AAGF26_03340 [Cyanobacteria bacterium P01_G01_bin.49]
MTAEKPETNGNQTAQTTKSTTTSGTKTATRSTRSKENKETSALSVKDESSKTAQGIQLITDPSHHLPGNRPIEASHLDVVSTYGSVRSPRPVMSGEMEIAGTLAISGQRPIMVSHLQVSETYTVMGNRPVAPNEIDDPALLMGYLD